MSILLQSGDNLLLQSGDELLHQQPDPKGIISAAGPLASPQVIGLGQLPLAIIEDTGLPLSPEVVGGQMFGRVLDNTVTPLQQEVSVLGGQSVGFVLLSNIQPADPLILARNDFTGGLTGNEVTGYVMDATTPSGTFRIPISSWQATLQVGRSNYVQCVIPGADIWVDTIAATTTFTIYRTVKAGGTTIFTEMATMTPTLKDFNKGSRRNTCTMSGYSDGFAEDLSPDTTYDRRLQGIRTLTTSVSGTRVRCDVDFFLRPAQRAYIDDATSFVVSYINYYVLPREAYMDVGERL